MSTRKQTTARAIISMAAVLAIIFATAVTWELIR